MLSEEVKELEQDYRIATKTIAEQKAKIAMLEEHLKAYQECCKMVIPNQVYTHKARRNTTVKFLDGSQITVTRKKGEKDCIETAIAYCVLKQLLPASDLRKLIENKEEH